jgi:hypothetical protein
MAAELACRGAPSRQRRWGKPRFDALIQVNGGAFSSNFFGVTEGQTRARRRGGLATPPLPNRPGAACPPSRIGRSRAISSHPHGFAINPQPILGPLSEPAIAIRESPRALLAT